ncbi:MAG: DUF4391 domain-containing protein [Bacteroidaceae bacterium]|nr:DUF4391 domain-containing protein [Bacteroidaceae bacterium]
MLGLPASTEISKQLPKKAIYAKFDLKSAQRDQFDADISKLTIVNAISSTTIPALQKGETVECIYVIDVALKRPDYDPKNIQLLSKLIPQNIIFAMRYEDKVQLAVYHTKLISGCWAKAEDYQIELKGLNLDKVWESLITDLGEITIVDGNSLDEQIAVDEAKTKLAKQIEDLEKKARAEKQPRKRLEYFEKIKLLRLRL